jgi:methylisocitrate lyase
MNAASASPGALFRKALEAERPLHLPGAINPVMAMIARDAGFQALYLSGSGVATASYGLPDLGMTTLTELLEDVRRITRVVKLPLIVDIDTGFGGELSIERTVRELIDAGAAGCHIEDQAGTKRCGHRPNKKIVPTDEMAVRVATAARARGDNPFYIIARTDSYQQEGLGGAIARCNAYVEAGADGLFPEAMGNLDEYKKLCASVNGAPVLANITEFGKTPIFSAKQLGDAGVRIVLNPLSIFRMLLATAKRGYEELRRAGSPQPLLPAMMPREEMYGVIGYHDYEKRLDESTLKS